VLHLAATNGDGAMVGLLVPATKTEVSLQNKSGRTPLQLAAECGSEVAVELLLAISKTEVSLQNASAHMPLH
jgi:ankyrin repeat protein